MGKKNNVCINCNSNYFGQGKFYCSIKCRIDASKGKPQKKRSEETKQKISKVHKGKKLSEETKIKIGLESKKNWENPEFRELQFLSRIGRIQSEETKQKISESQKGVKRPYMVDYNKNRKPVNGWKHTEESKEKISKGVSGDKNGMYGKLPKYNKESFYINNDVNIKMRSTWEVKFAYWLDENNKTWEYEKHTFKLPNGYTYTPDFYSDGVFYEVKGFFHKKSMEKFTIFIQNYGDKKIILVDKLYLKNLGIKL